MTDGLHPDAMDSPPCPACERNRNGIFSERYDHQWKCCKCGTIFDPPICARLRRYQRAREALTTDVAVANGGEPRR